MFRWGLCFIVFLTSCKPWSYTIESGLNVPTDSMVKPNAAMQEFMNPIRQTVQQFTSKNIGFADTPFTAERPSSMLGSACSDWLLYWCDSFMRKTHALPCDFAFLNHGGLRNALPKGKVNLGNLLELMPFENEVVILKLRGTTADSLFAYILSRGGEPVAGMKMEAVEKGKYTVTVNGKVFDKEKQYLVATSDYLLQGGDGFYMLKNALQIWVPQKRLREVFIDGVARESREFGAIRRRTENRIVYDKQAAVH